MVDTPPPPCSVPTLDQSYASSVTRPDLFLQMSAAEQSFRSSLGGLVYSPPSASPPLEEGTEPRPSFPNTTPNGSPRGRAEGELVRGGGALTNRSTRGLYESESFQDEGCSVS